MKSKAKNPRCFAVHTSLDRTALRDLEYCARCVETASGTAPSPSAVVRRALAVLSQRYENTDTPLGIEREVVAIKRHYQKRGRAQEIKL